MSTSFVFRKDCRQSFCQNINMHQSGRYQDEETKNRIHFLRLKIWISSEVDLETVPKNYAVPLCTGAIMYHELF